MIGRKRLFFVTFSIALLPLNGWGQARNTAAEELRSLEDELSQALVDRDAAVLDRLWHDDLIFIGTDGRQFGKAERIAGQRTAAPALPGETNVNDEVVVRIEGDSAVATVLSTWTFPTATNPSIGRYRALHVWIRSDGRWQLLAAQVAMLPR